MRYEINTGERGEVIIPHRIWLEWILHAPHFLFNFMRILELQINRYSPVLRTPSRLGPSILLSTLSSDTPRLCFFTVVRDGLPSTQV
jgi:hypothetical protein